MNPDVIGPLLAMQHATNIHDAHEHITDAIKAGASPSEVRQAITEWMAMQAAQVQTVFADNRRPDCCTGVDRDHTALPPYDHTPVTTTGGLIVVGWSWPPAPVVDVRRCWCGRSIPDDSISTCGCCCTEHDEVTP